MTWFAGNHPVDADGGPVNIAPAQGARAAPMMMVIGASDISSSSTTTTTADDDHHR